MKYLNSQNLRLVVFDIEGVLIPGNRFFFDIGKRLGVVQLFKILFFGFWYAIGIMKLKVALKHIFMITKGEKVELYFEVFEKIPIAPRAKHVFDELRASGLKIALISSGLPTPIVNELSKNFSSDYAEGVMIGIDENGRLTGEIWGDVIESNGKKLILDKIMADEGFSQENVAVVADDRNNASIFQKRMRKIGFNPDFIIRMKADAVTNGKFDKILPLLDPKGRLRELPSKKDIVRETIHASGFIIPFLAMFYGLFPVSIFIISVMLLYAISEFLRLKGHNLPLISTITRHAASQTELREFTLAPIYFAAGILLTLIIFPLSVSGPAIAIFALGDSTASIIGGLWSKKPLPLNSSKTIEGSLSGFLFAFLAATVFINPWLALYGATIGMIIEYLPLPINDNLLIPILTSLSLYFLI